MTRTPRELTVVPPPPARPGTARPATVRPTDSSACGSPMGSRSNVPPPRSAPDRARASGRRGATRRRSPSGSPPTCGIETLRTVLAILDAAAITSESLTVHTHELDDVFAAFTSLP